MASPTRALTERAESELNGLAEISLSDIEDAKRAFRADARPKAKTLLDAKRVDEPPPEE